MFPRTPPLLPRPAGDVHVAPAETELSPSGVSVHAGGEAGVGRGVPRPHRTVHHAPHLLGGAAAHALQDRLAVTSFYV